MTLDEEMRTFAQMRDELVRDHLGEYVVIHGTQLVGIYPSDEAAFADAMSRFGRARPFLLRRVSAEDETLVAPALVMGLLDAKLP